MEPRSEFVYLLRPNRQSFIETITEEEERVMEKHFLYLQQLLAEKKLVLAGPCLDGAYGICILQNVEPSEAQQIMENDPAVLSGIMSVELHPYRVSLLLGRD